MKKQFRSLFDFKHARGNLYALDEHMVKWIRNEDADEILRILAIGKPYEMLDL